MRVRIDEAVRHATSRIDASPGSAVRLDAPGSARCGLRSARARSRPSCSAGCAGCSGSAARSPSVESDEDGFFGWHFHAPFDTSEVKTVAVFFKSQRRSAATSRSS